MADEKRDSFGKQSLRPRARLLRTLGDELISSEIVALIELVKNSYDADADIVLIRFEGSLEAGKGEIEVIDNGNGMSLETIRNIWMEPATYAKRNETRSRRYDRRVLGEKGVGRFAASRLGNTLEVVTRQIHTDKEVKVFFDWAQFDDRDKYLDEIQIPFEEREPLEICSAGTISALDCQYFQERSIELDHGTILRMQGLSISWGQEQIKFLKTELSKLIAPFFKADFAIRIELPPPLEGYSGMLEPPEALKHPHYKIRGQVNASGEAQLWFKLKGQDTEEFLQKEFKLQGNRTPQCGPFEVELRVWDRDQNSLNEVANLSGSSTKDIRRYLNEAIGISVYRDGFRVFPYGEPNNDWLRLDARRVQNPTMRLSVNQIVGYVSISADRNPDLRDQSNREGLMEGPAFQDFRNLILNVVAKIEEERYKTRHPQTAKNKKVGGVFAGFSLAGIREFVQQSQPDNKELMTLLDNQEKDLENRIEIVQETLARYRRLAVLGQLIDALLHDGRTPLSKIGSSAFMGLRNIERAAMELQSLPLIIKLKKNFELIKNQSDILSTVFNRIEPFGGRKRGRPSSVALETVIASAFDVMEGEINKLGVRVNLPETNTTVTVDPTEIQEVVINLLSNSLYWLQQVPQDSREVSVKVERTLSGEVKVLFSDSGPGIDPRDRERIFEPYFSTKSDGVGLGLAIAGEIIDEYYSGSLELRADGPLEGANFCITLRKRV